MMKGVGKSRWAKMEKEKIADEIAKMSWKRLLLSIADEAAAKFREMFCVGCPMMEECQRPCPPAEQRLPAFLNMYAIRKIMLN